MLTASEFLILQQLRILPFLEKEPCRIWFPKVPKLVCILINVEELRDILSPLVHKCSKNVKKLGLPGIRDTVIHLKPTELQKELLKRVPENLGSFYEQNLMSMISVHPSLVANRKEFSELESQLKERRCRLDPDIGVKIKFVIELIRLCGG
uniref:SNF2 N-terminal domain-containing protein n=1 Tax=Solanum lycopersicum TaxID=4081 RepID=A0A3Q7INE4_SOLLC